MNAASVISHPGAVTRDVLLRVRGTVQGVGFRPFIWRTATQLSLRGWVQNDRWGVLIRAEGRSDAVDALLMAIRSSAPSAAQVDGVETSEPGIEAAAACEPFAIAPSAQPGAEIETACPPDLALCPDCRREMFDPGNRRYRYPFLTCTQCGPRYSILEELPYDRPFTTMRSFRMCPRCEEEYHSPADRRFHAQPNCCPECGPRIALTYPIGQRLEVGTKRRECSAPAVLVECAALLRRGGILAVKGIGGYHLMVDACNAEAVLKLRRRKAREAKPFAVMFRDVAEAKAFTQMTAAAERLLTSAQAPIVLLERRAPPAGAAAGTPQLAPAVAPGNPWIGVLLPYAPLQELLLQEFGGPLVATSANLSDEPLCFSDADAERRLAGIADAFLGHNRVIARPADDSVFRFAGSDPICLRRARGYAPTPLSLPQAIEGSWLCTGAQMKNTVAVASGRRVVISPHLGDLDNAPTVEQFHRTIAMLGRLHSRAFTAVACDRHPDYASTRYAEQLGLPLVAVQHHLAHVLACLLEHQWPQDRPVLGVAWDGTGYGEDGTIWGGEFLLLRNRHASRFGKLRPFRLPGGDAAVRDGRRVALALAHAAGDERFAALATDLGLAASAGTLRQMLDRRLNSPITTSAGRLFDAVGALLGLGGIARFEGQTALAVEAAAAGARPSGDLVLPLRRVATSQGAACELDWQPLFSALCEARETGLPAAGLAASFHRALAQGIVAIAEEAGVETVALSGGCFQNALLVKLTAAALRQAGFRVLLHRHLPPNDGNIAAGQALAVLWGVTAVNLP